MSQQTERRQPEGGVTKALARRLRAVRVAQGLSAQKLADRCAALGMPRLNRAVISTIENHTREDVSVAELFVLAYALGTSPVHLLLPLDDDTPVRVTPTKEVTAHDAREWVRGTPLAGQDPRQFFAHLPEREFYAAVADYLGTIDVDADAEEVR